MAGSRAGVQKSITARGKKSAGRPSSGVFAIPNAVAALYDVAVARDEYVGLDRLDRDELDETDDDAIVVILPAELRRSA
jgi:hypothetical protein